MSLKGLDTLKDSSQFVFVADHITALVTYKSGVAVGISKIVFVVSLMFFKVGWVGKDKFTFSTLKQAFEFAVKVIAILVIAEWAENFAGVGCR